MTKGKTATKRRKTKTANDQPKKKPGRPRKPVPTASQGNVATGHNGSPEDEAKRTLFFQHRQTWIDAQAKLKVAQKRLVDVKAAIKADGLLVKEFQVADNLATVKGEAKVTGDVMLRLRVARWIGHPMGAQLDLFAHPNAPTLSVVDQAREDGKRAAMAHETPKPPHSPETDAYRVWMESFHEEQAKQVRAGIKPTEPPANANGAAAEAKDGEPAGWGKSKPDDPDDHDDELQF